MNIFEVLIVQPIFNMLMALYAVIPGRDFGIAIIIFTILVRFVLYPLTRSMLHQSKAMRKLQPELAKIKKQAKGNKQVESVQMMELYKKHGVNPFRSIGILLIQLPIFISLYYVIRIFTSSRDEIPKFTYDILEKLTPVKELVTNPASFNEKLFGFIDLTQPAFTESSVSIFLILLAALAGYTQYVMSKQTMPAAKSNRRLRDIMAEAAEGKQADQSEMNSIVMARMSKILPFFMFFITVSVPGALALYFAVSNSVAVLQQAYLLKQDEEELEELADEPVNKQVKQAAVVKKTSQKKQPKKTNSATVTRIVAKDSSKRRK